MKSLVINLLILTLIGFNTLSALQAQCILTQDGNYIDVGGGPCNNVIVTAVPFLRIVADARSAGMGDAGIGLSADANAIHFNASKLAFAEKKLAISATYTPWLRSLNLSDVYLAYLTGYYQINQLQTLGMGIRYFSLGSIPFTDTNGEPLNTGQPNEFEINVAYARKLAEKFSASVSGKVIYSNLAAGQQVEGETIEPGVAGAADISFTYKTEIDLDQRNSDLTIGLAMTNIGSKITYTRSVNRDFLPANLGLGAAWELAIDDFNTLTLAADINKLMVPTPCIGPECDQNGDNRPDYKDYSSIKGIFTSFSDAPEGFSEEIKELTYSMGVEYWYDNQFAVRAGYFNENAQKGNRRYFTAGVGLRYNIFGLNFSYLIPTSNQRNPLDNTLRFSLLFDFGALGGK